MKNHIAFALVLVSVTLSACSKDFDTSLETDLKNAEFTCGDQATCADNIGMIFGKKNDGARMNSRVQCTGFLVASNIVATNAECIPAYLKNSTKTCGPADLAIRLKDNGSGRTVFTCKQVLSFSDKNAEGLDYAFFEIDETGRKPIAIAREGAQDGQVVSIPKFTPGEKGGTFEVTACKIARPTASANSAATSAQASALSTLVTSDCKITKGDGGAPVLNARGEAVAIVSSKAPSKQTSALDPQGRVADSKISTAEKSATGISSGVLVSNFSCFANPVSQPTGACASGTPTPNVVATAPSLEEAQAKRAAIWKQQLPAAFLYEIQTSKESSARRAVPVCVSSTVDAKLPLIDVTFNAELLPNDQQLSYQYKVMRESVGAIIPSANWIGIVNSGLGPQSIKLQNCTLTETARGSFESVH